MPQYRMFVTHFPTHAALVRNTFCLLVFTIGWKALIHLQVA